ncbi:polysaccharide pyruvyl transferase family protein [Microbacterium sp. GXF7504]
MKIGWLDPSVSSRNLGDEIIHDAVGVELKDLLGDDDVRKLPTQRLPTRRERAAIRSCESFVVGGTNLLNGNIPRYIQWKLDPGIARSYGGRTNLLGVGWWQYQDVNWFSRSIWQRLLRDRTHSVRDAYTKERLESFGLKAINTGCPTMWRLDDVIHHPEERRNVIATITDYHRNPTRDRKMLLALGELYDSVSVWLQGAKDKSYVESLEVDVSFIPPSLHAFDEALDKHDSDYFGTRLHAGVRALQHNVRATIVAIDNRATEISADTGLPIVSNAFTHADVAHSKSRSSTLLRIDREAITEWKKLFVEELKL